MLYLGADHRGFKLKESLKEFLAHKKIKFEDLGNTHYHKTDDYTDIGYVVAKKVAGKNSGQAILICGSGIGICITANKVRGIRAGLASSPRLAKKAKEDDNINILCLSADETKLPEAKKIVNSWLVAKFKNKKRFARRIKEIEKIEMKKFNPKII